MMGDEIRVALRRQAPAEWLKEPGKPCRRCFQSPSQDDCVHPDCEWTCECPERLSSLLLFALVHLDR
jgi:hypothetical protein